MQTKDQYRSDPMCASAYAVDTHARTHSLVEFNDFRFNYDLQECEKTSMVHCSDVKINLKYAPMAIYLFVSRGWKNTLI